MNDLQILILTLFLGLFGLLVNYLVKFFRSAVKNAEESQVHENDVSNEQSRQVIAVYITRKRKNERFIGKITLNIQFMPQKWFLLST